MASLVDQLDSGRRARDIEGCRGASLGRRIDREVERVRGGEPVHELRHLAPVLDHHHFEAAKDMRLNGVCWLIVEAVADLRIRFRPNLENEYEVDYRLAFEQTNCNPVPPGNVRPSCDVWLAVSLMFPVASPVTLSVLFEICHAPDDVTSAPGPSGLMPAHAESKDTALKATSANSEHAIAPHTTPHPRASICNFRAIEAMLERGACVLLVRPLHLTPYLSLGSFCLGLQGCSLWSPERDRFGRSWVSHLASGKMHGRESFASVQLRLKWGITMRIPIVLRGALVALIALFSLGLQSARADTGSITLVVFKGGWIIGGSAGHGTLNFHGRRYSLSVGGIDYGLIFGGVADRAAGPGAQHPAPIRCCRRLRRGRCRPCHHRRRSRDRAHQSVGRRSRASWLAGRADGERRSKRTGHHDEVAGCEPPGERRFRRQIR